ncbi:MAG: transporter substrate-binding domain-containing protein [Spirochaetaceae bacterium]|jgi:putative glutamine transport system substrate-binding protein|nr:transporter substrate-binding domain-containing protein [Spirochaetaceae bacterium]
MNPGVLRAISLLLSAIVFVACEKNSTLESIKKSGVLKVGIKADVSGFGLFDPATGDFTGLEVELARLIAKELLGDSSKVEFVVVTTKTRGPLLENNTVDMVIAVFTITEERKYIYNFSVPYYTDAVGVMVKKEAGYSSMQDLRDKTIGVGRSTTSKSVIESAAKSAGFRLEYAEFDLFSDVKKALDEGQVDAFCVDKSILKSYLDNSTEILSEEFTLQPYGIATNLANKELAGFIDKTIQKWLSDGTISALIQRFNL